MVIIKLINIAIDGPSGAGKSSLAKMVAKELNIIYVDTGAMYRAAALYALNLGIDIKNETNRVIAMLDNLSIDLVYKDGAQHIILNGEDVTGKIRTPEVSVGASDIAVIKEVRIKLVKLQQNIAEKNSVVMDGRDIGTNVLPNADVKVFLTASIEERARRRYNELLEKGVDCDFDDVKKDMEYRDHNDSSRDFAPLKAADDATKLDTTGFAIEKSLDAILKIVKDRI